MDTLNPTIRICAAARFQTDGRTADKALKQLLRQQSSTDPRRFSRLSLLAALGAAALKQKTAVRPDCTVYLATPFASPALFEKMAENVLAHHTAMPYDFIANLHNAPAFHAAQILGTHGAGISLAADSRTWQNVLAPAAESLFSNGQTAVGWCSEAEHADAPEHSIWLLLEHGTHGTALSELAAAASNTPSENRSPWQTLLERLQAIGVL